MKVEPFLSKVAWASCFLLLSGLLTAQGAQITVTTPPKNQTNCPGSTAVFTVMASASGGVSYQWRREGTNLTGQTSSNLALNNVGSANAGTYSVRLTSGSNNTTPSATLTVLSNVSATPLTNQLRAVGANAFFSTTASGSGPFTYVWRKNGNVLSGKTTSSLTLTNLTVNDAAPYSVTVSGACGSVSNSATLTVADCFPAVDVMLVIDRSGSMSGQPYNDARQACSNFVNNLNFATNADQAGIVSYSSSATLNQKLTNSLATLRQSINSIAGADGSTSITSGLQSGQNELASSRHRTNALPVLVLLSDGLPTSGDTGSAALAAATAAKNAGTRVFTIGLGNVDHALMTGIASSPTDYFYTTNSSQLSALFNAVSTLICRPPTNIVVMGPSNVTVCVGSPASFSVTAMGCNPFTYQWKREGLTLSGQTNNILLLSNVTATAVYSVEVTGPCKTMTNSATLTVNQNVVVTSAPTNRVTCPNSSVSFNIGATGTSLAYQWYYGATLLNGQTTSALALNNVAANQAGTYAVVVSGACGLPTTNNVTLSVNQPAAITNPPVSLVSFVGSNVVFSVGATGTGLNYQWFFNGALVGTNSALPLNNLTTNRAGNYCVVVSGACGNSLTNCTTLTIQNRAPVANNDSYTVVEGGTLTRTAANGVLINDTDAENNLLNATVVNTTVNGSLTLNADGSFSYTHNGSETTSDSFTYKANDGSLDSGIATVTIAITSVNDAPVANNDFYEIAEGGTLTRTAVQGILANDTDAETNSLTAILVSGPEKGALTLNTNTGSFTYVHNGSEGTNDSFIYRAHDGSTNSGIATVKIRIVPINDAPVANPDFYEVHEGGLLVRNIALGVLANDTDAEGTALTARALNGPAHGTLTLNLDGSFSYQHDGSETKTDTFTYAASDGLVTTSAIVTITIIPVNDAPVANNDFYEITEGGTLTRAAAQGILANDTDAETNSLTAILVSGPEKGTLTLNTNNGSFTYVHNGSEGTNDSFTYRAHDGLTNSDIATVTIQITPVNDAPVANNDSYTVVEGGTLNPNAALGVLANDTDAETNSLTAVLVSLPNNGALTLNPNGSFSYAHNGSETTSDSFTYKANDGSLDSGIATVTITITATNDAPVANNDFYTVLEDNLLSVNAPGVLVNDTDAETDSLKAIVANTTTDGELTLNLDGSFTYQPGADFNGTDSFTYQANDGVANSVATTVNITISPVNDAPGFTAGAGQLVNQNTGARTIPGWATGIQAGPADEQNQTVVFQLSNNNSALFSVQPAIAANGTLSFTPASNVSGSANVSVVLKDNGGTANGGVDTSATQVFAITVNAPPTVSIVSPTNASTFIWGQNITIISDAIDPDGSISNVEFFEGTNKLGEVPNAPYFLVLTNMQPGIYQFTAIATDNLGLSATSSVVLVTVLGSLPFTEAGPMTLNLQTGLIEQKIRVDNPTPVTLSAARVLVFNLPSDVRVHNASGTNNGVPFVQYNQSIFPGGFAMMTIEYIVPNRIPPTPTLVMEVVPLLPVFQTTGVGQKIDRALRFTGGTFLLEFSSVANRFYSVQYSADLVTWKTSSPSIQGTGSKVQWIDNGQPKTESLPAANEKRFYRIILLP